MNTVNYKIPNKNEREVIQTIRKEKEEIKETTTLRRAWVKWNTVTHTPNDVSVLHEFKHSQIVLINQLGGKGEMIAFVWPDDCYFSVPVEDKADESLGWIAIISPRFEENRGAPPLCNSCKIPCLITNFPITSSLRGGILDGRDTFHILYLVMATMSPPTLLWHQNNQT